MSKKAVFCVDDCFNFVNLRQFIVDFMDPKSARIFNCKFYYDHFTEILQMSAKMIFKNFYT